MVSVLALTVCLMGDVNLANCEQRRPLSCKSPTQQSQRLGSPFSKLGQRTQIQERSCSKINNGLDPGYDLIDLCRRHVVVNQKLQISRDSSHSLFSFTAQLRHGILEVLSADGWISKKMGASASMWPNILFTSIDGGEKEEKSGVSVRCHITNQEAAFWYLSVN